MDCQQMGIVRSFFIVASHISCSTRTRLQRLLLRCFIATLTLLPMSTGAEDNTENLEIALALADVLRAARSEIASQQPLINDATIEDKGLDGERLVELVKVRLEASDNAHLWNLSAESRKGVLIQAQLESIREVINENQSVVNRKNVGFKGFVPAVFARLVNERFGEKVGDQANVKVTAPPDLVRNRKSRPDSWELSVIEERFESEGWETGMLHSELTEAGSLKAFRVMVPEYYGAGCMSCHGSPKGAVDITGYPKEGGAVGDLGGAISVTLFQ